jgi:ABC-2 type transport system ATP-binding protein
VSTASTGKAPIIRARGITKRFGDFTAVDDLALSVEPGSIYAFLGANGSGKSTTIRMLIGLLTPTAGEIEVDGVDVLHHPRRVRDRIGYMGQKVSLYQGLTLRENVEFYGGLYDLEGSSLERRWSEVAERFDLVAVERERVEDLSAGVRQRAGLAVAILHRPRVLFLDEPTAGVDLRNRSRFWEIIQEEADTGVTVFVTTHFLEEVELCDWVSFIDSGRLIANAAPEALRAGFADGYRVEIDLASTSERETVARKLAAVEISPSATDRGLSFTSSTLDSSMLATLAALTETGDSRRATVRIEQPEMNEVFRRLIGANGQAR